MLNRIPYNKPYKSPKDLVQLLLTRGLIINDFNRAESYIHNIGYYRLSAYMYPHLELPKEKHIYKNNKTFQNILDLYKFDKKLRLLIFNEIEKIEIAYLKEDNKNIKHPEFQEGMRVFYREWRVI